MSRGKAERALAKISRAKTRGRRAQDIPSGAGLGGLFRHFKPAPRVELCADELDELTTEAQELDRCESYAPPVGTDGDDLLGELVGSVGGTVGTLVTGVLSALAGHRLAWTHRLASWQTPRHRDEMHRGQIAAAKASSFHAWTPGGVVELARIFENDPTPYHFGKLSYAVCDILAVIEGDKPA